MSATSVRGGGRGRVAAWLSFGAKGTEAFSSEAVVKVKESRAGGVGEL